MKRWIVAFCVALLSLGMLPSEAEAKRLGGGGSSGLKRDMPARTTPDAVPAKPANPAPAATPGTAGAAAAAAAAPKRNWLGPVAGLAAGLGLAALASHLGFGEELANFMMLALLAIVAVFVVRWLMRRFGPAPQRPMVTPEGMRFSANETPAVAASGSGSAAASIRGGFDAAGFERIAKMIFIRMQAANDSADLNDLRAFTTPEMFAAIKLDLQDRQGTAQQTDVVQIDASVIDTATEADRQIVSVRFRGLIREQAGSGAEPFDEVWHLVKPVDGSREWAIAGIQQTA